MIFEIQRLDLKKWKTHGTQQINVIHTTIQQILRAIHGVQRRWYNNMKRACWLQKALRPVVSII